MKAIFILIVIALVTTGFYHYFGSGSYKNPAVRDNMVTVDAGDFKAEFSVLDEFRETHMLFGGEYFNEKSLISPIILYGLEIADAQSIYATYPDFYRCKSPGAALAQPMVKDLNLIPADRAVLKELRKSIEVFANNLASDGDRVCLSLTGKTLHMQTARVLKDNTDIKDQLQPRTFHLINSSKQVACKDLLDQPN